jgi:2'-carboxy-2,3-dihydroxybiphenyl 1,2-dioxygenase small subunit/ferredoxin
MKVSVDTAVCREYANCIMEAPDVFDIDETAGKAVVLIAEPSPSMHDDVRRAVSSCPTQAISIAE